MFAGYCVAGTVGHKILNGTRKIEFKKGKPVEVKMSVQVIQGIPFFKINNCFLKQHSLEIN